MKRSPFVLATLGAICWATIASAQQVSLTLQEGRVSLRAQNATIQQILAAWEQQGQVRIVGVDRLTASQPITIDLSDVTERQALDVVLRGVPGYMVVDRTEPMAGASRYDRLVLLAKTTTPSPAAASAAARVPAAAQPYVQTMDPQAAQAPDRGDVDQFEDNNVAEPPMPTAPVVNPYPNGNAAGVGPSAGAGGSNVLTSGSSNVTAQPPETQFDYANPQRYFERMRQMQATQQPGQQPGQQTGQQPAQQGGMPPAVYPGSAAYPGSRVTSNPGPTATPSATGTLAQPGIAPTPTTPPPQQQQFFNPYNLPPEQLQGNPTTPTTTTGTGSTTPVQPDRAKYANPYQPAPTTTNPPE